VVIGKQNELFPGGQRFFSCPEHNTVGYTLPHKFSETIKTMKKSNGLSIDKSVIAG